MAFTSTSSRSRFGKSPRGFTLIELLVVLSIMAVITGVFLVRNGRFNSAILLRSFSYQVALSIREAQVYGVGVKEVTPGSGNFSAGFGVYFSSLTPTAYILFADVNNNGVYDTGDIVVENFTVANGFAISEFCATTSGGAEQCSPSGISALSITFRRPNPEPTIRINLSGYVYSNASITAASPTGSSRTVTVGAAGEIAVEQVGN